MPAAWSSPSNWTALLCDGKHNRTNSRTHPHQPKKTKWPIWCFFVSLVHSSIYLLLLLLIKLHKRTYVDSPSALSVRQTIKKSESRQIIVFHLVSVRRSFIWIVSFHPPYAHRIANKMLKQHWAQHEHLASQTDRKKNENRSETRFCAQKRRFWSQNKNHFHAQHTKEKKERKRRRLANFSSSIALLWLCANYLSLFFSGCAFLRAPFVRRNASLHKMIVSNCHRRWIKIISCNFRSFDATGITFSFEFFVWWCAHKHSSFVDDDSQVSI